MYENDFPMDAPRKVRALLVDDADNLVLLQRIKPNKPVYHVTAGGKIDPGETKRKALIRELHEELDARVILGRPLFSVLDTTFFAARLLHLGDHPFTGPEFSDKKLGRYAIASVPIAAVISGEVDLQPEFVVDFLRLYQGALLGEIERLRATHK